MRRHHLIPLALCLCVLFTRAALLRAAEPCQLTVVTDRPEAVYRAGETVSFLVTAKCGGLSLDINAHGIPNGQPPEYYADLGRGELKDYRTAGRESRDTCYFLGMFLRLVRAIDFLASQPEWNGRVLCVEGHSQGGGQALAAAGLDPRVTFLAAGVPAICDHTGAAVGRINGWPKLVPNDQQGKPDPKVLQVARYFDGMNFATRTKAEAILSVGFIDTVCPPTSVYAAYNNLTGKKQMVIRPLMGHRAPPDVIDEFTKAIWEHIKRVGASH